MIQFPPGITQLDIDRVCKHCKHKALDITDLVCATCLRKSDYTSPIKSTVRISPKVYYEFTHFESDE